MHVPVLDLQLRQPSRGSFAWYGTVGVLTAAGMIEWPLAAVVAASHLVATSSRSATARDAAEAAEDVAG